MAKSVKIPTLAEMQEHLKAWKAAPLGAKPDHPEHAVIMKAMTIRIFSEDIPESARANIWGFCKQLTKFSHAPVSPADYKRMEKYKDEHELIDVLLKACDGYFPDPAFKYNFDTIGFSYSIALISISDYRRQDCLALLDRVTQYYVKTKDDWYTVLLRNMQKLEKEYPDLAPFKTALENI